MSIEDIIQDLFCTVLFQCLKTALSVVIKCDNMEEQTDRTQSFAGISQNAVFAALHRFWSAVKI